MTRDRNHTIDIAKGLGIILVVFGHNWMVVHGNREIFRVVFSFHMPLFLFLSGIFLKESGSIREFSISRMQSLLKPYFTTLLLLGLVKVASDVRSGRDYSTDFLHYINGVLYATGRTIAWPPLWYLPHLFIVSCAALLAIKAIGSTRTMWLVVAISLGVGVFQLSPTDLPWSIDLLPISFCFLLSGYLCREFVQSMKFDARYFFLSLAPFSACHYFYNHTIDLNLRVYDDFAVSTLQAALGIYLCLSLASLLARSVMAVKILGYIGAGTLFVLLFHSYIQDKAFGMLMKLMGESSWTGLLSLVAGVVFPLMLWECARRNRLLTLLFLPRISTATASPVRPKPILGTAEV